MADNGLDLFVSLSTFRLPPYNQRVIRAHFSVREYATQRVR